MRQFKAAPARWPLAGRAKQTGAAANMTHIHLGVSPAPVARGHNRTGSCRAAAWARFCLLIWPVQYELRESSSRGPARQSLGKQTKGRHYCAAHLCVLLVVIICGRNSWPRPADGARI